MTAHSVYRVTEFQIVAPYTLRVRFDDQTEQVINFEPVLAAELYRPLRENRFVQSSAHRSRGAYVGLAEWCGF
jgi:hypothetical protein